MQSWMRNDACSGSRNKILGLLSEWTLRPVVDALQAMRGIALIHAVVLVAEVGDFTRFSNPRQLMAYFGLVPGERSSGETIQRYGITKTGNNHARRALVEGAWAYRMRPRIGRHKVDRIEALPKIVRDIGWKAQIRRRPRISRAALALQDRQRRQCRYCPRDGRIRLVDRVHGSIRDERGVTATQPTLIRGGVQTNMILGVACGAGGGTMLGSPRLHYEPFDARYLDRGSPKRKKVMRLDPRMRDC